VPKAQSQKEKDALVERKNTRRASDRSAMFSLSQLDVKAIERRRNPLAGLRRGDPGREGDGPIDTGGSYPYTGAPLGRYEDAGAPVSGTSTGTDDSSSTATRTSSCVSTVGERDNAMNFANSFIQFVKHRQLL
jgi:hypothetical protein